MSVDWRILSGTFRATLARVALPMDYVSLVAALGNRGARHQWHNHQRDARWDGFFHQSGRAVGAAFRHSGRVVCSIWSVEFGVRLCVVQVEPLQAVAMGPLISRKDRTLLCLHVGVALPRVATRA